MPTSEVNKVRDEVRQACLRASADRPGFFSLTVPTGGGKTLSSLVWAMNHAVRHGKRRVIIAIPYTSIIVQTAAILKRIFGEENVLEHHSNTNLDEMRDQEAQERAKLATENWDYPIIVTTNVQLFESMMASRPSPCRKLHNICNSVLILDEVQTLPTHFLQPIIDTLGTYQRLFGVSILLTTASQPALEGEHEGVNPTVRLKGLAHVQEIMPQEAMLHVRLRRAQLQIDRTRRTYDEVAKQLAQHDRVLCIVNTRRDAKELFDRLPPSGIRIHLSRMMCPAHIRAQIERMTEALANPEDTVVRVVSTQLIEAGVDIDFPVVYRQEAGLDSLLQAAGRCNREGKLPLCTTHVFSLAAEHGLPRGHITQCNNARLAMGDGHDWFAPETMALYFKQLYCRVESFDEKDMKHFLYTPQELMFEDAAQQFRLIDDAMTPVLVNYGEGLQLAERLKRDGPSYGLVKRMAQYSVSLRKYDLDRLMKAGVVQEIADGFYAALHASQYDAVVGLLMNNQWLEETYVV